MWWLSTSKLQAFSCLGYIPYNPPSNVTSHALLHDPCGRYISQTCLDTSPIGSLSPHVRFFKRVRVHVIDPWKKNDHIAIGGLTWHSSKNWPLSNHLTNNVLKKIGHLENIYMRKFWRDKLNLLQEKRRSNSSHLVRHHQRCNIFKLRNSITVDGDNCWSRQLSNSTY